MMTSSFQMSDSQVLLLPNSNPSSSSSSSLNLKIDEFILKPFSIQKLVELISRHISLKEKEE